MGYYIQDGRQTAHLVTTLHDYVHTIEFVMPYLYLEEERNKIIAYWTDFTKYMSKYITALKYYWMVETRNIKQWKTQPVMWFVIMFL